MPMPCRTQGWTIQLEDLKDFWVIFFSAIALAITVIMQCKITIICWPSIGYSYMELFSFSSKIAFLATHAIASPSHLNECLPFEFSFSLEYVVSVGVQFFIWKTCHNSLIPWALLCHRGVQVSSTCSLQWILLIWFLQMCGVSLMFSM